MYSYTAAAIQFLTQAEKVPSWHATYRSYHIYTSDWHYMKLRLQRCPDAQVIQYEGINPYRNRLEYYRIIWPAKIYEKKKRERERERERKCSKSTTRFGNKFIISTRGREDGI